MSYAIESWGGVWPPTAPAVVATAAGRLDVFLLGTNGQFFHYWRDPGAGPGLESLGGSFRPRQVVATRGPGRVDAWVTGFGDRLTHASQELGAPFRLETLPGSWYDFGAASSVDGVDLYADAAGLHWSTNIPLLPLGGLAFSEIPAFSPLPAPGVASGSTLAAIVAGRPPGLWRDLFYRSGSRVVHLWRRPSSAGFGHEYLPGAGFGGSAGSGPAAVSTSTGRFDVFSTYADRLNHWWQDPGRGFGVESLPAVGPGSVAATGGPGARLDAYVVWRGRLQHFWQDGAPFGSEILPGVWSSHPAAATTGGGRHVFLVGEDRQLYHLWQ